MICQQSMVYPWNWRRPRDQLRIKEYSQNNHWPRMCRQGTKGSSRATFVLLLVGEDGTIDMAFEMWEWQRQKTHTHTHTQTRKKKEDKYRWDCREQCVHTQADWFYTITDGGCKHQSAAPFPDKQRNSGDVSVLPATARVKEGLGVTWSRTEHRGGNLAASRSQGPCSCDSSNKINKANVTRATSISGH